ncbi:MAG: type II toxin-antitoxin system RelE/ParE family toxin [Gammaproteobacteria bacterium]|nr:type II toxin-antitoxin system RelE/ParE family toxin [Gammaproteobacteria bacterium]
MIQSFKDKDLELCWENGKSRKIRQDLIRRVLMRLDSMDAATCIEDLQNPPSNNLHKLHGDYLGYWSIAVNGPWRLIFRLEENNIYDVFLIQYH